MLDNTVVTYEKMQGSEKLLRTLLTDAGIAFDDEDLLQLLGAMVDCFVSNPAFWCAFKELLRASGEDLVADEPSGLDDSAAEVLGQRFRLALIYKGIRTDRIALSQFYWFGLMASILLSYPQVNRIVTNVVNHQPFGVDIAASLISSRVH